MKYTLVTGPKGAPNPVSFRPNDTLEVMVGEKTIFLTKQENGDLVNTTKGVVYTPITKPRSTGPIELGVSYDGPEYGPLFE